jgi:hypothetical protein
LPSRFAALIRLAGLVSLDAGSCLSGVGDELIALVVALPVGNDAVFPAGHVFVPDVDDSVAAVAAVVLAA